MLIVRFTQWYTIITLKKNINYSIIILISNYLGGIKVCKITIIILIVWNYFTWVTYFN